MKSNAPLSWLSLAIVLAIATNAAAIDSDRIVVLISLDGLAGYYLDDPQAELTTVRQLAAEGTRAKAMKAVNPTVTWPNHTTLVTGVTPARHGVVGNNYFDRLAARKVTLISDPVFDKSEIVKVPTIYDLAKAEGLKTAAVYWPATRNAAALDWTTPEVKQDSLVRKYTTPELFEECQQAGLKITRPGADDGAAGSKEDPDDATWTKVFNLILEKHHPNLALLHLVNIDHTEHATGPQSPEAYAAIKTADDQVRNIWNVLKKEYPDKATLFVVSDHGFSPIDHQVLPNVVLKKAGLVETAGDRITGGAVQVVVQGGSALVYVLDEVDRQGTIERVKKAFADVEGVAKIVGVEDFDRYGLAEPQRNPHSPDLVLFAKMGWSFGDTAAGSLPFIQKPERKGSHGHDAELPELHATFVAWGYGIKPGAELGTIENTSVAPTIARLLGLAMPDVEGKPLEAMLAK